MGSVRRLADEGHAGANVYVITLDAYDGQEFRDAGGVVEMPVSVKYWANVYALHRRPYLKALGVGSSVVDYMTVGLFDLRRSIPWGYQKHADENVRFLGYHAAVYGMFRAVQKRTDLSEPWRKCLSGGG